MIKKQMKMLCHLYLLFFYLKSLAEYRAWHQVLHGKEFFLKMQIVEKNFFDCLNVKILNFLLFFKA